MMDKYQNKTTEKKTINLTELFKRTEIQSAYDKARESREQLSLDDIVDKPIQILGYEEKMGPSMKGGDELFLIMRFKLIDDDTDSEHFVRTQSMSIWEHIKAIPPSILDEQCVTTMVSVQKTRIGGKRYFFSGLQ